jgi:protease-4
MDQGPFLADKALEAKLVDILGYEEQAFDGLKAKIKGRDLRKISQRDYVRVPASSLGLEGKTSFALVVGEGTITRGGEVTGFSSEEGIRSQPFIKMLRDVGADSSVKGVILRINSPGGDAIASEEILQEVRSLSRKKPMVISMSDLAASGGYYMAMTGDPIVSYSNTITGSIGVVFGKPNFKGFFEKVGIDHDVLKRGKFADIDTVIRPMTEEERAKLREGIDYIYRNFLARVSEGRKRQVVEIAPLAEGRAWMGAQAHDRGLVDELGGLDRAIELLKRKANVNASEKVRLVAYPRKKSLFEQFLNSPTESTVDLALRINARRFLAEAGLGELDLNLMSLSGYLKIAPYQVDFK